MLEFGTRGGFTNDEGGVRIGNLFYGTKGWLWIEEAGKTWQSCFRTQNERARADLSNPNDGPTGLHHEYPHYQNFIDAIRAGDPKILTCDVLEGHLSSTLPHLGNISYQVGRQLTFDGKSEKFVDDKQADKLLTREYRKGFEIPSSFGSSSTHDQAARR